jgi:phosphoglycolate phosphatase
MSAAMHDLALVMFDLDGTLVATAGEIQDAVNDTLAQFNLPPVTEPQVEGWIGHGTRSLLAQAVAASTGRTAAAVRASDSFEVLAGEFATHYGRRCGTRSWLYPHVRAVLTRLRLHGVMLAVVTNKEEAFAATVLDRHGLSPLLDLVACGDTAPAKKPDPAGLVACMAQLQVPAHRALFVDDSSIDAAAARAARVRFWAVDYGYNMGQPIARERPVRLLADVRPLLELTCGTGAQGIASADAHPSSTHECLTAADGEKL